MSRPLLIGPFTQLLPMTGLPLKGVLKDEQLTIIENGGILVSEGKILKVGAFNELISDDVDIHHIEGNHVCLPGFVDSHTHICFGGTRARDYAYRNAGKTYLEIAKAGVSQSFTTRNALVPGERIALQLVDGPFSDFRGVWEFKALSDSACKITLDLHFEYAGIHND